MNSKNIIRSKKFHGQQGLTLVELMIAAVIMIAAFTGVLLTYIKCVELSELSKNSSIALSAAKNQLESIKNTPFANIFANYNQVSFNPVGLTGKGVSYIDNTNPDLLKVTISVSWRQSNGRIIGEDKNLNGTREAGEGADAQLDSPVGIVSNIYNAG